VVGAATWVSTQKLLAQRAGFVIPERYEFSETGSLTTAHLNISEASIEAALLTDVTIATINTTVPIGVDTTVYDFSYGVDFEATTLKLRMTITTFTLNVTDVSAKWEFAYSIHVTEQTAFGTNVFVLKYSGLAPNGQSGAVLDGATRIDWNNVAGTIQRCDGNGANCAAPTNITSEFLPLGEWTVEE
jgi:hypothetical protein